MSAFSSYQPSGKYSPAAFGIAPAFGILAGSVIGYAYVMAVDLIPSIWVGAVSCVVFAFATGIAAGFGFSEIMDLRADLGWVIGSGDGFDLTGGLVYLVWVVEAAIVIGCSTIAPVIFTSAPFCEETKTWAKKQKMGEVAGINPDAFKQAGVSGDLAGIVSPMGQVNSPYRAYYELHSCQGGDMYVTAKLAYKDKKNKDQQDDVVDYIHIDAAALEGLQNALKNGPRRPAPRKPKELPGQLRSKPGQNQAPQQAAPMASQQPPQGARQQPATGQKPRLPSRRP
ncbi:MAG: hypothetical protein V3V10_07650 [Planctomycetota bacterium]